MTTQKVPVIPEITNDVPLSTRRSLQAMKVTIEYLLTQVGTTQSRFGGTSVAVGGGSASQHNATGGLQGGITGSYFHLTETQHTDLTDGGNSALHYHASDRDLANATGVLPWAQINSAGASLLDLDTREHNDLQSIQGGSVGESYHLSLDQWGAHVSGGDNTWHYHQADRDAAVASAAVSADALFVKKDGSTPITGPQVITVDSADPALRVTQAGAGHALVVEDAENPDATPLVVDNEGFLGLNTVPTRNLHIHRATSGVVTIRMSSNTRTFNLDLDDSTGNVNISTAGVVVIPGSTDLGDSTADTTKISGNLILPKDSGYGVKVDTSTPTFGWRDLEGPISLPQTAAQRPTLTTYASPVEDYAFSAGDHYGPLKYHIPHDYVPGSDLFIHVHWSHNGTDISGSIVFDYFVIYAKGHNQAAFPATPVNLTQTVSSLNITNSPTRRHRIDEIQLSAASPSASQIDSDDIEVDGLIIIHFDVPTIPTITGGAGKPFVHYVDIHYQSTNMATKQKAPNFYV